MDLALEFGMPVEQLSAVMTERELGRWLKYAGRRIMPMRRIELHLAQLSLLVARGPLEGASDLTIEDFLFEKREAKAPADAEINMAEVYEAFGYRPRKKK